MYGKKVYDETRGDKEFIALKDLTIHSCIGCRSCKKTNTCGLSDGMTPLYKKLLDADVIVLGSPNFFANVSGITKDLIDRTLPFYHKTALKNKKIFLISTGHDFASKCEKYMEQGTHGFVQYHKMKLIGTYGFCSEDEVAFKKNPATDKKIKKIVHAINYLNN